MIDWAWFCKVSTSNGVIDLMYNPKVYGKPEYGEVCIWLSYWPIGNALDAGDTLNVSIVVISGLEVHECGVSLAYSDMETLENKMGWVEILGGDLSGFQLSTGAYYLCRRDFFELMEVHRSTPDWFRTLVGDTIDYTEVRGWRKTGRLKQVNPSFTELKTTRCIIHGSQLDDIYKIADMPKSAFADNTVFITSLLEGEMKSSIEDIPGDEMFYDCISDEETFYNCISDEETFYDWISTFDETMIEEFNLYSQEDMYKITELFKSFIGDKVVLFKSSFLEGENKSDTGSEFSDETMEDLHDKQYKSGDETVEFISTFHDTTIKESDPFSHGRIMNSATGEGKKPSLSTSAQTCRIFSLVEIISATNNFDDKLVLGSGRFGTVYKGLIFNEVRGHVVAIKRLDPVKGRQSV